MALVLIYGVVQHGEQLEQQVLWFWSQETGLYVITVKFWLQLFQMEKLLHGTQEHRVREQLEHLNQRLIM
jgi:hypothetical protein